MAQVHRLVLRGNPRDLASDVRHQVLLGVTGSGNTFTVANVIAQLNRPTLVLSHNKTLAAQRCAESRASSPTTPATSGDALARIAKAMGVLLRDLFEEP